MGVGKDYSGNFQPNQYFLHFEGLKLQIIHLVWKLLKHEVRLLGLISSTRLYDAMVRWKDGDKFALPAIKTPNILGQNSGKRTY